MRRRQQVDLIEPPGRLVAYDEADWLPDIDPDGYDPDDFRNRSDGRPYGEPRMTLEDWCRQQARNAWTRARLDWCRANGWPGGLTVVDLLQQQARVLRPQAPRRTAG